ncbi:hypothetical protein [Streptomyces sp. NBC_00344]|uniref:hypothetical protein n=1 Tax=Streptomyces sp. NBC_00344 TaxID=2975720 RepID=UPI002E1DFB72
MSNDYQNAINARALSLVSADVIVRTTNGVDLAGTLTSVTRETVGWPSGSVGPIVSFNVTDADDKLWTIDPSAVLAIAG